VDLKGPVSVNMEMGAFNENSGTSQFTIALSIMSEGKSYFLEMGRKETQFNNVVKADSVMNWNIVIMPGSIYRVKGYLANDETIEANYLSLEEVKSSDQKMTFPMENFLSSTKEVRNKVISEWNKK
jgi:hypothetical protein